MTAAIGVKEAIVGVGCGVFGIYGALMLFNVLGTADRAARSGAELRSRRSARTRHAIFSPAMTPTTPAGARVFGGCLLAFGAAVVALVLSGQTMN